MSAFNPHHYKTSAAEWQEIAKDTNEETGAQFTIIGGVVLGLFAAAAASPITGLLVAGYFGFKAWQDTQAANRNDEAIDSYGCVAHLLRAGDLRDYTRQVGVEKAIQEITWAVENGYRVSSPALDLLESQGVDVDALVDPPALPAAPVEDAKKSEPPLDFLANEIELLAVKDAAMPTPSVSPNQVEPIPTPETFDIPIEEMPVLQPPVTADDRYTWTKDLLNFPAVLVWGAQGSGKTSFTAWLLRERIKAGHTAEVWDVHREFGQWDGLPVFGDGMDYEAIDRRMLAFERQVKADYQKRATDPKYSPKRHTVICEEFTNFARRCEHSAPFFEASLSDLRKVRKGVIFVSHGRSLAALGGSQGFAQTRNSGLLELQLEAKIDPATGDPTPAMKGKLKLPGKAAIDIEIAPWMNGSMNFTAPVQSGSASVQTAEPNGSSPVQDGSSGSGLNPGSNSVQWLNRCLGAEVQDSEPNGSRFSSDGSAVEPSGSGTFTAEKLTAVQARDRIAELKAVGMNQTQIILSMWRAKKGANKAYQDAITEYKFLSGETIE